MKKKWQTPKLETYDSVESMTQVSVEDVVEAGKAVVKIGKFLLPGKGNGLFASLQI